MSASPSSIVRPAALGLGLIALAALTGLAFAAWLEHAPGIFTALIEQGLAWCL